MDSNMNKSPDLVTSLDNFIKSFSYPAQQGLLVKNIAEHPVHARADRGNAAAYFSFLLPLIATPVKPCSTCSSGAAILRYAMKVSRRNALCGRQETYSANQFIPGISM
jgi:hypothetical protein